MTSPSGGSALVVLLAATVGWLGTGCATTTGTTQLQADLDTLQQQVWKLQKENAARAQQAAPSVTSPPPEQQTAELKARLETLAHEVQVLQTRAEESEQRLNALSNDLRAARAAIESMGRAQAAMPASPNPATAAPPTGSVVPMGNGQEPSSIPPPTPKAASGDGADLFRRGYSSYSRGNYDQALSELEEFLRLHPGDEQADEAQYLVGEALFSQQKYPEAIGAYDRFLKEHADGERAASAHLKKGLALLETNRTADAVIQFQHVVNAYPKSEEARSARDRLRALGLRER